MKEKWGNRGCLAADFCWFLVAVLGLFLGCCCCCVLLLLLLCFAAAAAGFMLQQKGREEESLESLDEEKESFIK